MSISIKHQILTTILIIFVSVLMHYSIPILGLALGIAVSIYFLVFSSLIRFSEENWRHK